MEVTKKVGGPDPSGPQGHPSVNIQLLGGDLRGSQGQCINSGSLYIRQGLSVSSKAVIEGVCGAGSQAHAAEPIYQMLQDSAQASSQCSYEQALRTPTGPLQNPIVGVQPHLIMEDGTLTLPVCRHSNNTTCDTAQHGPCCPQLQVQVAGEGKAPAKVLVGWGKGPSNPDQMAPLGTRKSRWLPYILSGEDAAAVVQSSLPAPAQAPAHAPAQGQGQGNSPCPAQTPTQATASSQSPGSSAPAHVTTPALDATPTLTKVEPYAHIQDHPIDPIAITKNLSQDLLLRKYGNQRSVLLESSKVGISSQDKVSFQGQEEPSIPLPAPVAIPDHAQEHEVSRRQVPPEQPEKPVEKPLVSASRSGSPEAGPEPQGTPKSQRINQEVCSSQTDQQSLNVCNTCSPVLPAFQDCKQAPVQAPREAIQIPLSSAPTCQLREAVEDHVLVFDMATGSTRMGLLCHDPLGSRAVLVGFMPSHPSIYIPETILSARPLAMPILTPDSNHASFWSTTPMLSSPVPSSLSSGSYREVALVPKEARLNLESRDSPGANTPIRVGMLTGPIPLGVPHQFGERIVAQLPDLSWSKPNVEKNEASRTIWMLDAPRMPDASVVQIKKLQWVNAEQTPEPAPPAKPQEDMSSRKQEEVITVHPNNPQAECAGQALLAGQFPVAEQHPSARQTPLAGQPPSAEKPPLTSMPSSTKQPPLTGWHPLVRQTTLARQFPLTRQAPLPGQPFSKDTPITKEPPLSRGTPVSGEPTQASTLCQEGEPVGLPTHVGVLRMPLAPEETCICKSRDKIGISVGQSSSMHQLPSWQPGSCPTAQEEQLSLLTFTTPGTGCQVFPMALVSPESQGWRLKLTTEDITHSSVVTHLGLLRGTCYELVSTLDPLPVQSPVLCRHSLGPYQDMAAVVIDTGTGFTKCGLAGEDHVLSVVPSRVQLLQHSAQGQPRYAVSENREGSCPVLNRGVVSDWDALEVLWQHLFYCSLGVQPEELAVLVADSPISPRTNREKVAEILFERFHVPAMQTVHQALLALYAYGRTTGLVLGSGHGTSYVAPILTGDLAPLDTYRLDVAGADLTDYLAQLLLASGRSPPKAGLVNQIKEATCYVAMDMAAEMARTQGQSRVDFVLPDKQVITLGSERFSCPEALFQPSLLGLNQPGLPQLALLSISRLEAKQQEQLLANVVLDGGTTLVSGFPERLRQELGPGATVLGSPHRAVAAWLGGSIMACRDSFQSLWLSRREYEEEGPWAIYKYQL
ncbi:uncharacterized protein [Dasypus novemcinctus]|uniref:uncharacterized protein n=1 Tax=Dasypus novemcinctus TaxID=9361 RepID=UPI000328F97C|nr:uncharacterized protein LOC101437499 [Dasypus novemcinctus]